MNVDFIQKFLQTGHAAISAVDTNKPTVDSIPLSRFMEGLNAEEISLVPLAGNYGPIVVISFKTQGKLYKLTPIGFDTSRRFSTAKAICDYYSLPELAYGRNLLTIAFNGRGEQITPLNVNQFELVLLKYPEGSPNRSCIKLKLLPISQPTAVDPLAMLLSMVGNTNNSVSSALNPPNDASENKSGPSWVPTQGF